jgi:low affinity Fe/Cu permease
MARKKQHAGTAQRAAPDARPSHSNGGKRGLHEWFSAFSQGTAWITGRPATFFLALLVIVVWAVTGPLFGFSDTWQLVINTGTTIITFLMVFLIQNTQYRDTMAIQLKLGELIIAMKGVSNKFAVIEDLSDEELEKLHEECKAQAEHTLHHLTKRKATAQEQQQ